MTSSFVVINSNTNECYSGEGSLDECFGICCSDLMDSIENYEIHEIDLKGLTINVISSGRIYMAYVKAMSYLEG
jgi:hypothetical protein